MKATQGLAVALVALVVLGLQDAALALTPDERVQMLWQRADWQLVVEKWDDMPATGRRAVAIAPESADAWALLAYARWLFAETAAAGAACDRALALDPDCCAAHHVRGLLSYDRGHWEAAGEAFGRAIALAPGYARAHGFLGLTLSSAGQAEEAVRELGEAHRLEPTGFVWAQALAWALAEAGRVTEGLEQNARALEMARTDYDRGIVHNNAAYFRAWAGEGQKALEEAHTARGLCPQDPDMADTLGALTALFGEAKAAEAPLRRALKSASHWSATHTALAYALVRQGRQAEAREELASVSRELVEERVSVDALYFAGRAYEELGETIIARRVFIRATQRWPKHPWSEEMRGWPSERLGG